jgi:hypothetical protein
VLVQEDKDKALKTLEVKLASYQFLTNEESGKWCIREGLGIVESFKCLGDHRRCSFNDSPARRDLGEVSGHPPPPPFFGLLVR